MRTEKKLIEEIRNLIGEYDGLNINDHELDIIKFSEEIEICDYVGLKDGHDGLYTYEVKLNNDDTLYSLYIEE